MNETSTNVDNTDIDWSTRSPVLVYTNDNLHIIYFSIAWGGALFLHSCYLHHMSYTMVRIVSEIASLSLLFEATCFYQCVEGTCTVLKQAVVYNVVGNCFFGLLCQICDNYLTFQRYQVVVGKASTMHKTISFSWWFVLMFLTWWPFFSFLPVWYDQNSEKWLFIQIEVAGWIDFISFTLFNLFYLMLVCREIVKLRRVVVTATNSSKSQYLTGVAVRAIFHTVLSTLGILLYVFNLPDGVLEQNILIAGSIHIFLNWKFKVDDVLATASRISADLPKLNIRWNSSIPPTGLAQDLPPAHVIHIYPKSIHSK